jgi:hypothetical protein
MAQSVLMNRNSAYNWGVDALAQLLKQQKVLYVPTFECEGMTFNFRVPYRLDYKYDGQYYLHENEELDIHVREEDFSQFVASLYEQFYVLWTEYAEEQDDKLHTDAREFKKLLLSMCEVTK